MYLVPDKPKCKKYSNKGKLVGQKSPLKLKEVCAIRIHLQIKKDIRNLALFNLALDSKLRSCDLVKLKLFDIAPAGDILSRARVIQQKTHQLVQFEITKQTRETMQAWIDKSNPELTDYLFPSPVRENEHLSTRQYGRLVKDWVASIDLNPSNYGTHTLRRTKVTIMYRQTKNIRAIQLLLGHTKLESTVRYLGVEVDDALDIAEGIEI